MTDREFDEFMDRRQSNPEMAFIKHMFSTINDSILVLSAKVEKQNDKLDTVIVKNEKLETRLDCFQIATEKHFSTCPVDDLREHTGQIDVAIERLNAKKSDPKISRPPAARGVSDRTLQLIAILAIIAIGGGTLLMQVFS